MLTSVLNLLPAFDPDCALPNKKIAIQSSLPALSNCSVCRLVLQFQHNYFAPDALTQCHLS